MGPNQKIAQSARVQLAMQRSEISQAHMQRSRHRHSRFHQSAHAAGCIPPDVVHRAGGRACRVASSKLLKSGDLRARKSKRVIRLKIFVFIWKMI